jgi:trimeric autotransporter adhesin
MKRGLNHKNSLPDPEFGRESSESARAIHYVVQKDTLMTYVSALIAQADLRKLRGSTIERKQMSTKTIYKRIALVAVASLGAGLLSVAPASAVVTATGTATFKVAGSTTAVTVAAGAFNAGSSAAVETIYVRSGAATQTFVVDFAALAAADALHVVLGKGTSMPTAAADLVNIDGVSVNSTNATIADAALDVDGAGSIAAVAAAGVTVTTKSLQTAAADFKFTSGTLAAGTYSIWVATDNTDLTATSYKIATVTSHDVGAPVTASYSQVGYVDVASPEAIAAKLSFKDSSNRSTFLVGDETVGHTVAKQVPASDATLDPITGLTAAATPALSSGVFAARDVSIPANGTAPTVGSLYTITSTILNGASAFGSTTVTYRNVASTLGLTGSIAFIDATSKAVVSSIARATSGTFAGGTYGVVVKDSTGAVVVGVTPVATATAGTVSTAIGATDVNGTNTAIAYSAAATAGTATVSIALSTGSSSLTTSFSVVTTAYGATAATNATVKSVVAANGSGVVMTSTAPNTSAWSSAINVTGFTVTLSGLEASKAAVVQLTTGGGNAVSPTVNGTAAATDIFPVASATGEITLNLAVTSAANGNTLTVTVDPEGNAGAVTVLVITYATATNNITTDPKSGSLNMSTPSATKVITAAGTDQFKNPITGGSFKLTNTVVPAGATAATAVTVNQSATGTATLNAVLGATLGTYTFTVELISVNAAVLATSTINYSVTTTGIAGSLTLTDTDTGTGTLTTDDKGTRAIVVNRSASLSVGAAVTDTATAITVTTASPTGLAFTATATNGIRLFTSAPSGTITPGLASVTGTAGASANLWAVPTKVGAGTITVVAGGITKVYTLTATLNATATTVESAIVTLTPTANAGQYTVKATDAFGNGVVNDVAVSVAGPGTFSNGFKNLTVTTGADGTNTFNVVSDGSSATTITARLSTTGNGAYVAIDATQATAMGVVLPGTLGASTPTATATLAGKGGDASATSLAALTTLINSLIAKINALNKLVIKIQKKVRA